MTHFSPKKHNIHDQSVVALPLFSRKDKIRYELASAALIRQHGPNRYRIRCVAYFGNHTCQNKIVVWVTYFKSLGNIDC